MAKNIENKAQVEELQAMTIKALTEQAQELGLTVPAKIKKADLIDMILGAGEPKEPKTEKKASVLDQLLEAVEGCEALAVKKTGDRTCFINRVADGKHVVAISGANKVRVFFTEDQNKDTAFTACLADIIDSAAIYLKKKGKQFVKQGHLKDDTVGQFVAVLAKACQVKLSDSTPHT